MQMRWAASPFHWSTVDTCLTRTTKNVFGTAASPWKLWNVAACDVDSTACARNWLEMASSMRMDKEVFFRRLDELDELAFETDSEATSECALKLRRLYSHNNLHDEHTSCVQEISNSEVRPTPSTIPGIGSTTLLSDVITMPAKAPKRREVSGKVPPELSRKRRPKKSIQLQSEDAQIFRGLVFCEINKSL